MKKKYTSEGLERKQEILDHSLDLFSRKGYSSTSVMDIIQSVGVSKGAFYHYFDSKDEVLDEIIEQYILETVEIARRIAGTPGKSALEKYKELFAEVQKKRDRDREKFFFLSRMMISEKNILFTHKYVKKIISLTTSPYAEILAQGKRSGEFDIDDPEETAEMIMRLSTIYRTKLAILFFSLEEHPENKRQIKKIVDFLQFNLERILGLEAGALSLISTSYTQQFNLQ